MSDYIDITKYIKEQESRIKEILNFHIDRELIKKECASIIDGTINYLWRNGFSEEEIDSLVKNLLNINPLTNVKDVNIWSN